MPSTGTMVDPMPVRRASPAPAGRRRPGQGRLLGLLVVPLIVFVLAVFVWPVLQFLALAVDNSEKSQALRRTAAALAEASYVDGTPGEATFQALVADLAEARRNGRDGVLAQLINQRVVGSRYLVIKTAKDAADGKFVGGAVKASVISAHPGWDNPALWRALSSETAPLTDHYLLGSLDMQRAGDGAVQRVPPDRAVFVDVIARTVWISLVVTLICALLAVPLAQAIANAPPALSRVMFALVLFPLWTSLLVRTVIWIIVLQRNGPVNTSLVALGLTAEPLDLIYTRFSLYVAMVQVLLPMMVLSVLSVMRRVPQSYMRAALSLGAPWAVAWYRVHLPLILPGILAGSAIVFVFSLGYYITPMLVGGPADQMISSHIAFYTNTTLNWGMGAALSVQLLAILALGALLFWTARSLLARERPQ